MSHIFTRQQLYDLIWAEPTAVVAKRLGVSGVWLRKNCILADIPLPPRGYWAKKKAGKLVTTIPLPRRELGQADELEIGRRTGYWYQEDDDNETLPPPKVFDESPDEVRSRADKAVGRVVGPKSLKTPHRLIAQLLEEDDRRRQKLLEVPYAWEKPRFDSPEDRRKLRIVNGLFLALSRAGMRPTCSSKDVIEWGLVVGDMHVGLTLEALEQKKSRRQALAPTRGRARQTLRLEVNRFEAGDMQHAWQDGEDDPLENHLREVAVTLIVAGEMQYRAWVKRRYDWRVERRREREEAERRRLEKEEQERRERQLALERKRRRRLMTDANAWRQAANMRAFIEAVRSQPAPAGQAERLDAWIAWATAESNRLDPLLRPLDEVIDYIFEAPAP